MSTPSLTAVLDSCTAIIDDYRTLFQDASPWNTTTRLQGEHIVAAVRQLLIIHDSPAQREKLQQLQRMLEDLAGIVSDALQGLEQHASLLPCWRVQGTLLIAEATTQFIDVNVRAQTSDHAGDCALLMAQAQYHLPEPVTAWYEGPDITMIEEVAP